MKISRRDFFARSVLVLGGAWLARAALAGEAEPQRPNFIFCMTDDQGWGDTGYNGHPTLRTPNLDRMAAEGIRFDRFYAGAPVCSPTRGSCLTGRHPYRYGITTANVGFMKPEETTLAEVLKRLGYTTGHFGKWHLGTLSKTVKDGRRGGEEEEATEYAPPWENGFEVCFSTESKAPTFWKDGQYQKFGTHYWTGPEAMVPADQVRGDDSGLIMDRALSFITTAAREKKPFLAVIWFHAPHRPVVSAPPFTDGYTENKDYYGCLTAMDGQMGRLRAELRSLGIEEQTMLWFCSDNGPEGADADPGRTNGLRGRKRSLYEGGVRVPGLLVWPGRIQAPRRIAMPCVTSDYFPTVLDVLGYRLPPKEARPYDGISLMPLLAGVMSERPRPIAFESLGQTSLVDNRFKLYRPKEGAAWELYDLPADPQEQHNLAGSRPDVVRRMAADLEAWRRSCAASDRGEDYRRP